MVLPLSLRRAAACVLAVNPLAFNFQLGEGDDGNAQGPGFLEGADGPSPTKKQKTGDSATVVNYAAAAFNCNYCGRDLSVRR